MEVAAMPSYKSSPVKNLSLRTGAAERSLAHRRLSLLKLYTMFFHPIINRLANIDLHLLVKPANEQRIEGQTACFCPICKNGQDADADVKQTPHFIIFENERGGLYSGVGVDDNRMAEHGAVKWKCTRTGKTGYGAIELYAAKMNIPMHGYSLQRICQRLVRDVYGDTDEVRRAFPEVFAKMDYRTQAQQTIETFSFMPKTDFSPQELAALGCEVTLDRGMPRFGFGSTFTPDMLNKDFRIYSLLSVTLPDVIRDGQHVSEIIHGTPWNPLFVCFASQEIGPQNSYGCFFRPTMAGSEPIVFSTAEEHSVRKVSKWLMGDNVFVYAMDQRKSDNTAVHAAIQKFEPTEKYTEKKEIWVEREDKDGVGKGTFKQEKKKIPTAEIKARNIVFCRTPEDALSVYYAMRSLRLDKIEDQHFQDFCWYHVAFSIGRKNFWYIERGEWKRENLDFSAVQYQKMNRFAEHVIILYPNDIASQRNCGAICTKFSTLYYAMLPEGFRSRYCQRWQWLYGCSPRSVRDYLLTYSMNAEENFQFDHDVRLPLYSRLRGARNTEPFEIEYPRDPRSGKPKPPTCKVSPTRLWLFMTAHGYYRMIDPESTDLVGQYIHLNKCFVEYIDAKSIIQAAKTMLLEYIEQAWRHSDNERRLMSDCANMVDKAFTEKSAGGLQSMVINFADAFDAKTEYFYFNNVALKITPDSIRTVSYDDINFFIPSLAKKSYDFTMRVFKTPFTITERQEYRDRLEAIDKKEKMQNEDGSLVFSTFEIGQMKADLEEWAQTYRWDVNWQGKQEKDLWPILRIVRGCSNVLWEREQEAQRNKEELTELEKAVIGAHFVNMISGIGRLCYRSDKGMMPVCPYFLEDDIPDEKQATGGSGKSIIVKLVVGSAVNVLDIDMKRMEHINDARFVLGNLLSEPFKYRVLHWEDKQKGFPMKYFYNMVTTGLTVEKKSVDQELVPLKDAPKHVITCNYPLSDDDDSTVGRFPLVSFSNRFARANPQKRKAARLMSALMKNFSDKPEEIDDTDRNQAIYICALAVQFLMRYHTFAIAPQGNVRRRQMVQKLTESIVRYFEWFFSRNEVYGVPICTDDMFNEFMRDWADASEGKSKEYSRATFKKKIYDYCENMSITCNPKHLFENESDKQRKCFKLQAWVTQEYFTGREWENDNTIEPKFIRYLQTSKHVFFFFRPGKDAIPKDYRELKRIAKQYAEQPDPLPYRDDDGNIITLTDEEKERWENNKTRKQGRRMAPPAAATTATAVAPDIKEDMPF